MLSPLFGPARPAPPDLRPVLWPACVSWSCTPACPARCGGWRSCAPQIHCAEIVDEQTGEEVERVEPLLCRRCASEAGRSFLGEIRASRYAKSDMRNAYS